MQVFMYYPVAMEEKGIGGTTAGFIVGMQAAAALISSPIWTKMASITGTELIILLGTLCSGFSLLLLGIALRICEGPTLIWVSFIATILLGASSSAMMIGE